ncbi:hypothetical protein L6164_008086 [Bauhinia variegata]|uniref:Uncharacterized protein n=1 Tax=Bauhinia variegata TaxID=167791 RepID=A0ACB9PEM7_BAUVA|nr:hypothetical protein L6164_008086 [Bauhinia variegata]
MPTAVSSVRQCLTEEAARVLDDAVAVARRRSHAQTTSLHAISALLALPSSMLRDACTRARNYSCSLYRQFRALELSVSFSLDRTPSSKSLEEDPPVSNSLMAAIKRSQANQRRHPESFYLLQMHTQQLQTASLLKVELKHFILSILDDPTVSRVFADASFRSSDIKISLLHPPVPQTSRFSRSRCPPIFLCNLTEMCPPGFNFPFLGDGDEDCKRIGEVLARKTKRNPLLMGFCAKSALHIFMESVQRGRGGVLPAEVSGLNIISIEEEISEFLLEGESEEKMVLKFKDLSRMAEQCSCPGIAVNFGELEVFVGDAVSAAAVSFVVLQLTNLLQIHGEKFWLVGVARSSDTYSKFLHLFPTVEKDWDMYLLPMTSATPSVEGFYSISSLMGSFVPFAGFFSTPSEVKNPVSCTSQPLTSCHISNEKHEQEVADIWKLCPTTPPSGCSTSLPSVDTFKGPDVAKVAKVSKSLETDMQNPMANMSLLDCKSSSSSLTSVATDLGLGTLYSSAAEEPNTPILRDHKDHRHCLSDSLSADQSSCAGLNLEGRYDLLDFKSLNLRLTEKVWWQDEAIYAINRTLSLFQSGAGKHCGSHVRGDTWLAFLGPDSVGKKKIASALAEVISGNTGNLISVDLSSQDRVYALNPNFECQKSYYSDVLRRKTVVDYIAGELSKKPHSVVFLENIEKADYLVQTSLFQAIRRGKFPDSHGREISINNTIFLVTSTVYKGGCTFLSEDHAMFSEERILEAKRCQMQLLLGKISEDFKRSGATTVKIAPEQTSNPTSSNKRKLLESSQSSKQGTVSKIQRGDLDTSRSYLDLNMPLQEAEEDINQNDPQSQSSEAWLNDFFSQIDEKVAFKPVNFDALAEKFLKSISIQFQRRVGPELLLEIDYEVMLQILAAAWLSDKKNAVDDWVEDVLGRCFNEAQQKYHAATQCVMKLVACDGNFVEEQALGVCLPAKIYLN